MAEPGNINPHQDADELDDQLFPRRMFLENQENNHYLDYEEMKCQHPIILEILKKHLLSYAFSEMTEVPKIYVQ